VLSTQVHGQTPNDIGSLSQVDSFAKQPLYLQSSPETPVASTSVYESAVPCGSSCDTGCADQNKFGFRGWIDAGYIWNTQDPTSRFNGPYNAVDRSNEPMMNQFYLIGEKKLDACQAGFGGRFDLLYGEDFFLAESIGMEKRPDGSAHWNKEYYGLAFPQAFISYGTERANLQVGHFYSVVGYEGLMAPDNFFYSKAYSYQFAGPFTHWGAQGNVKVGDRWNVNLGLTNGWDALDRVSDDVGFVGKARYDNPNGRWASFALVTGKEFNNSAGLPITDEFTNRTRFSLLLGTPILAKNEYVFHYWSGVQEAGAIGGEDAHWYGIDQYFYRTINNCWKAAARVEWFRDDDGTRVGLNRANNPNVPPYVGNFYSISLGLNYRPTQNLVLRPDVRFDWYDGDSTLPYDDGNENGQTMFGFDAIYSF
jgi:hypothetical protein